MHQTKTKFLVHPKGCKSAEIGSPGHMECIKLKLSWCASKAPGVLKLVAEDMWNTSYQKKFAIHQHGPRGAEIGTLGHVECITIPSS